MIAEAGRLIHYVAIFGFIGDLVGAVAGAIVNGVASVFSVIMDFIGDTIGDQIANLLKELLTHTPVPKKANGDPAIVSEPSNDPWTGIHHTYYEQFTPLVLAVGLILYVSANFLGTIPMFSRKVAQRIRGGFPKLIVLLIFGWPLMMFSLYLINAINGLIMPKGGLAEQRFGWVIANVIYAVYTSIGGPQAVIGVFLAVIDITLLGLFVAAILGRIVAIYAVPVLAPWAFLVYSFGIPGFQSLGKQVFTKGAKIAIAPFVTLIVFKLSGLVMSTCTNCSSISNPQAANFDYASIGGVGFGGGIVLSFVIGMAIPLFGLAAMYFVIMGSAPSTVSRGLSSAARATRRRMYNSGGAAGNSAGGGGDGDGSNSGIYGNGGIGPSVSEAVSNTRVAQADGKVGKAMTATGLDRAVSAGRSAANIGKKGANALPTIGSSPAASAPGSDTAYQEQGGGSSYDGILNQNKAHRGLGDQVADTVSSATKRNKQKAQSFAAGVKSKAQTGKKGGKEKVNEMLPGLKNEPESTVDLGGVGSSDQSDGDSEVSEADEEFAKTIAEKGETAPDVEQGEVGTDGTVDAREEDGDISPAFEGIGADGIEGETGGEIETLDHIFENEEGPVGDDDVEYEIPDEGVGLEGDTTYAYDDREELEEIKDKVVNDDRVTVDKDELERGLNPNKGDGVSEEGFGLDVDQGQQGGRIDVEWADGYDDEVERTANAMGGSRVDGAEGYISTEEMDSFEGEQFTENLHPDSEGDLEEGAEENGATLRPGDWTDGDDMVDGSIFGSESGSERTQYNDNGYDIDHDTANRTDLSGTLDDDPSGRDLVDSSDSSRFNDLDLSDGSTTVGVSHKEEYDELREKVESSDDLEFTKDRAQELLDQPDDNPEEWDAEFTIRGSGDPSDGGDSS